MAIGLLKKPVDPKPFLMGVVGFTLIEILVVVVIISIVISAASFLLNDSTKGQTKRSAINALQQRLLLAEQTAIITGQPLGFAVSQSGYQFYRLQPTIADQEGWQLVTHNRALNYQTWPTWTNLTIHIDAKGEDISISSQLPKQPMIILNPSGTMTPFQLTLDQFVLNGELNGTLRIEK